MANYTAKNITTGREYEVDEAGKKAIQANPEMSKKYSFQTVATSSSKKAKADDPVGEKKK